MSWNFLCVRQRSVSHIRTGSGACLYCVGDGVDTGEASLVGSADGGTFVWDKEEVWRWMLELAMNSEQPPLQEPGPGPIGASLHPQQSQGPMAECLEKPWATAHPAAQGPLATPCRPPCFLTSSLLVTLLERSVPCVALHMLLPENPGMQGLGLALCAVPPRPEFACPGLPQALGLPQCQA